MEYYYRGVVSWEWFYPHHYAPMISDMTGLAHIRVSFAPGMPFRPFQQLLAVLPAASCKLLPEPYQVRPPQHMHAHACFPANTWQVLQAGFLAMDSLMPIPMRSIACLHDIACLQSTCSAR